MSSRSILLSNSVWNALAFLVGAGLSLVTIPFAILHLGIAAFGLAGLVTACVAPALIFSNTLALMTARELARTLTIERRDDARRTFGTSLALAFLAGFAVLLLLAFAGPPLAVVAFNLKPASVADIHWAFAFAASGWLCQCCTGVLMAPFMARQNYSRIAAVAVVTAIVAATLMFGLVPQWPRASTFLACQAGGLAAGLLAAFLLARVSLPEWLAAPSLHPQVRRRLVSVGSWQALALAGGQLSGQIDRYLLGAFLLPQNVGFYNVAQRLEEAIYVGVIKISETLFPFFSTLSDSEKTRQSDLFFRAAWLLGLVAVSVLGGLIPVAGDILRLWVGANVAAEAERVLVILTIAGIIGSGTNVFSLFLTATGGTRGNAILSMVTAFATVTTSVVALPMFGWAAAGFSSLVGMLAQMAIMLALLSRRFDMAGSAARIVQDLLTPIVAGIIVAFALRAIFMGHGPWSWWQPIAAYMFSAATISFAVIAIGVWGRYGVMRRQDIVFIARRFLPSRVF